MASPSPSRSNKQSSRWGSFLSQAVAGVESRLDTILQEAEGSPSGNGPGAAAVSSDGATAPARGRTLTSGGGTGASDADAKGPQRASSSNAKIQARLQERLAKAVVKNQNASGTAGSDGSALPSGPPSGVASPTRSLGSPRASLDTTGEETGEVEIALRSSQDIPSGLGDVDESNMHEREEAGSRQSLDSNTPLYSRGSLEVPESTSATHAFPKTNGTEGLPKTDDDHEVTISQMRSDFQVAESRRQEEVHTYLERIDALQAKLQYLTKEAAEAARKAASESSAGSPDKKLAEKDEQIALLMEEGQKLSKTELKHMNTIKKLRSKQTEDEKATVDARANQKKAENKITALEERIRRAETASRRANADMRDRSRLEKELNDLKAERDSSNALITSLREHISEHNQQKEEADKRAQQAALDIEKKKVTELQDDLSNAKIEKELSEERLRAEIRELKEKAERERERARVTEVEMKGEQSMLESRVEALRARVEEASTGATGDAQAKLIRQVETLQSQYAVASENWQGIEGSLLTRVTNLEKERDELAKREGDIRRKARDSNLKAKRTEEEIENTRQKLQALESDLIENGLQLEKLQTRAEEAEKALQIAKEDHDKDKQTWESDIPARIEQEKRKWREELATLTNHSPAPAYSHAASIVRTESPTGISSLRKTPTASVADFLSLQPRRTSSRPTTSYDQWESGLPADRDIGPSRSRRTSSQFVHSQPQQLRIPDPSGTPPQPLIPARQDSLFSSPQTSQHGNNLLPPETPSIHTPGNDQESMFESHYSSPHRTIGDMISTATVGAGPSVQLAERMSAAVRRLESEKAASKDELARLASQRDEARTEIVALMREVEEKRSADSRIATLEKEIVEMNDRYQTTLEMLGEKSELVEELRADVADVKKIYRELVDSTM